MLRLTMALAVLAGPAFAAGELNVYTWGDYTSPEAIAKFEAETGIKVTIGEYDSNDAALATLEAGGHGYDIALPSANFVAIYREKGLIRELDPSKLPALANVEPRWRDVPWDPGRKWSVPYLWGATGLEVNTTVWNGDPNTSAVLFEPPAELAGKVNLMPDMSDVIALASWYVGAPYCTEDREALKKVRDLLVAAKPNWIAMDYGSIEKMIQGEYAASMEYNGAGLRAREKNPAIRFGYPKEGFPLFMDSLVLLRDAKNVDEAYAFMDFVMRPENAALFADFAKYVPAVTGAVDLLPEAVRTAPEFAIPEEAMKVAEFLPRCDGKGLEYMTAIWTEVTK